MKMLPEIIKDKITYERAIGEINTLMDSDPEPSTREGKRLELLVHLVEKFEQEAFNEPATNPIDAILFRMEQENLKQTDLVPFIGSRSKVSEVLSGKRPLTLPMIQALNTGLGIPAEVLVQPVIPNIPTVTEIDWKKFPVKEMCSRGWINNSYESVKKNLDHVVKSYFESVGGLECLNALNRTSQHTRAGREMNRFALAAWTARVMYMAAVDPPTTRCQPKLVTLELLRRIAKLSVFPDGPLTARKVLKEHGITLVVVEALPKTYLDGSAIMTNVDNPIIGLSLRYDRIDNFWFSLMHELAHISLHYGSGINQFFDDLDIKVVDDPKEADADAMASEALIPSDKWQASPARVAPSKNTILRFARQIDVHPAVVAGRIRRERNSYHLFNDLVGHGRIRHLFCFD